MVKNTCVFLFPGYYLDMPSRNPAIPSRLNGQFLVLAAFVTLAAALSVACTFDVDPSGGLLDMTPEASAGSYADRIIVSWPPVPGACGYNVYACDVDVGIYVQQNAVTLEERTYECRTVLPYFKYFFKITAITDEGETPLSRSGIGWVSPANPQLIASGSELALSWDAIPGAEAYVLERATSPDGPFYALDDSADGMVLAGADYNYDTSLFAFSFDPVGSRPSVGIRTPSSDSWFRIRAVEQVEGTVLRSIGSIVGWSTP